ncbi:hypothetical protein QBC45DRAFT_471760, partial [Copromyces sp. CBS 386.78]
SAVKAPTPRDLQGISADSSSGTRTPSTDSSHQPTSTPDVISRDGQPQAGAGDGQGQQPEKGRPTHDPLPTQQPSGNGKGGGPNIGEAVGYSILGLVALALVIGCCVGLKRVGRMQARANEEYEMSRRMRRGYR